MKNVMNVWEIKQKNRKEIYYYIREKGVVSKQDIVYDLQLSLPTVTQNLDYLKAQGLIDTSCKIKKEKAGGRIPTAFSYIHDARVAIGLDITQHHIKSVVVDLSGNIIDLVYKRQLYEKSDQYLKLLGETVEEIIEKTNVNRERILGVGIAVPGLIDEKEERVVYGRVIDNIGMTRKDFSKYISYPTKLVHDSNASGYAEVWSTTGLHNAFYISLCNSIGGSVLINDTVYKGDGVISGEIGHLNLVRNGKKCYCGQKGCFDTYCNAECLSDHTDGDLSEFFQRLEAGDERLMKVWGEYLDYLAMAVSDVRMLFGCTIILGGYVGAYMKDYISMLCERVDAKNAFGEASQNYLRPCKYKIEAVAAGAAITYIDEFIKNIS